MEKIERLCIEGIYIKSFKDIKEARIGPLPLNAPWIFLTGENGMGKTVFLQAIASGLHPIDDQINETMIGFKTDTNIEIHIYGKGSYGLYYQEDGRIRFMGQQNFTLLSCYGPSRLQTLTESGQNERAGNSPGINRLFGAHTFLKNIDFALIKWKLKKDSPQLEQEEQERFAKRLAFTKKLFIEMLGLVDIRIDISADEVKYFEKGTDDSILNGVKSYELGAGYRNLLGFVGDMIINLINLQPENLDPSELYGIVIIDELELHLHPRWQREIPGILSHHFKNIQFIASTHSPIPLLGAPDNSVFLKVDRTEEDGIAISRLEKLEKDIKFLKPNAIFTSDIFDFEDIKSSRLDPTEEVRYEDDYRDIEINDNIKERLKGLEDETLFPEDLFEKE